MLVLKLSASGSRVAFGAYLEHLISFAPKETRPFSQQHLLIRKYCKSPILQLSAGNIQGASLIKTAYDLLESNSP
jgi:hypothetical protein